MTAEYCQFLHEFCASPASPWSHSAVYLGYAWTAPAVSYTLCSAFFVFGSEYGPLRSLNFHPLDQVTHRSLPIDFFLDFSESVFIQSSLRKNCISSFSARLAVAVRCVLYCVSVIQYKAELSIPWNVLWEEWKSRWHWWPHSSCHHRTRGARCEFRKPRFCPEFHRTFVVCPGQRFAPSQPRFSLLWNRNNKAVSVSHDHGEGTVNWDLMHLNTHCKF